jgi:hypothetical protein
MRRAGWISLLVLLGIAACGPPEVSNIGAPQADQTPDDDGDDATSTQTAPTPTNPPAGAPTMTNVPSFATWQSDIKPLLCMQCHMEGAGAFVYAIGGTEADDKFYWFQSICNRDTGADDEGIVSYSPPVGREGDGTAPPNCADLIDYENSQ